MFIGQAKTPKLVYFELDRFWAMQPVSEYSLYGYFAGPLIVSHIIILLYSGYKISHGYYYTHVTWNKAEYNAIQVCKECPRNGLSMTVRRLLAGFWPRRLSQRSWVLILYFFYSSPGYPCCPAHLKSIGCTTWAIWEIKLHRYRIQANAILIWIMKLCKSLIIMKTCEHKKSMDASTTKNAYCPNLLPWNSIVLTSLPACILQRWAFGHLIRTDVQHLRGHPYQYSHCQQQHNFILRIPLRSCVMTGLLGERESNRIMCRVNS